MRLFLYDKFVLTPKFAGVGSMEDYYDKKTEKNACPHYHIGGSFCGIVCLRTCGITGENKSFMDFIRDLSDSLSGGRIRHYI